MITKLPIDCLTNNDLKRLTISSIKRLFDNLKCLSNSQNANFDCLTFDCGQSMIIIQQIYCIYDNIVERLNNGLIFKVNMNKM